MLDTEEQCLDAIENCNYLLDGFLSEFNQTDNTLQGSMITQCKWFKERAENYDLSLPVPRRKLGSLLYIYTNGEMFNVDHTTKDKIMAKYTVKGIELYINRIISLVDEAQLLLLKLDFYLFTVSDLIFNGVRPDSWLTIEDSERETQFFVSVFPEE